ncbi:MAG: SLC13/DASS family transporter [Planctomycetaceae bacterium]|nr:SLC13/DASS family transporter [Planctomycetaceae bacterium]
MPHRHVSWKNLVLSGVLLSTLGLLALESPLGMTHPTQIGAVILITAATLWITEVVPLFVTSFVVLLLSLVWLTPVLESSGQTVTPGDFLAPFFSDIILLFLGGFVLSSALHKFQLDDRIARTIIARTGNSVPRLLLGVMAATAGLSMWLSNTATAATMLALCLPIIRSLPTGDAYRKALILGIPFAANLGGLGTPVGSPPNAIAMQFMRQAGFAPKFWMWMLIGVPGVMVMLGLSWAILMVLFRGEQREFVLPVSIANRPISSRAWIVIAGSAVTMAGWMTTELHGFSAGTVALIPLTLFFGLKLLTVEDLRALSWDVLLVMGGGACLGTAIGTSGLDNWIVSNIPLRETSLFTVMAVFGTLAMLMSSVMSNTAAANLLMPIALGLSVSDVTPVMVGVAFACTLAMPLPISTPPNAMAFGSGELSTLDMLKPGLLITVIGTGLAFTTGYWWWDIVGLF